MTRERAVIGLIAILAISVYWTWPSGEQSEEREMFSQGEESVWDRVEPVLKSLLPEDEELPGILADYRSCDSGSPGGTDVTLRDGEVSEINDGSFEEFPNEYTSFCSGSGGEIGVQVMLPRDRTHLRHIQNSYDAFAKGSGEALELLVEYKSDSLAHWGEIVDSRWIEAGGTGDHSYGYVLTLDDPESNELYYFANVHFTRGVVMGGLHILGKMGADRAESEAMAMATAFDDKVVARSRSAAASDQ